MVVILESHSTGEKHRLTLRDSVDGYFWEGLQCLGYWPRRQHAKNALREVAGETHLIHWRPGNTGELFTARVDTYLEPSLAYELRLAAKLYGMTLAEFYRRLIYDFLRPGQLPPLDKEFVKQALEKIKTA